MTPAPVHGDNLAILCTPESPCQNAPRPWKDVFHGRGIRLYSVPVCQSLAVRPLTYLMPGTSSLNSIRYFTVSV